MPIVKRFFMVSALMLVVLAGGVRGEGDKPFFVGGDISALTRFEELGMVYKQDGWPGDLIKTMMDNGCNCFRLRLFVNPNGRGVVIQDMPYTIKLARRIKTAGAKLLLDLHYSDTWADPAHQVKPAAWKELTLPQLQQKVEDYTFEVISAFAREGVLPEMVQVGNEITPGFLWPDGKLGGDKPDEQWQNFTSLLKAGIKGLRRATPAGQQIRVMIHVDCGGDAKRTGWFFDGLQKHGVEYDMIGLSYYPWWHGSMSQLRDNLDKTARAYNKDIMVVETAYLNRDKVLGEGNPDQMIWPKTPAGQKQFMDELMRTVRTGANGRGIGVCYWYPESAPVKGLSVWHGGAMALFDEQGNGLPALQSFKAVPAGGDPNQP